MHKKEKDKRIFAKIARMPVFKRAKTVFVYLSHKGEVSTDVFVKKYLGKKRLVVPRVHGRHIRLCELSPGVCFKKGTFGVREPEKCVPFMDFKKIDVAFIPGVAFDKRGHRIGFGGGFFDRFLKKVRCTTIGLAYEFQIVEKVPEEHYDMAVDYIVTERRTIKCVRPVGFFFNPLTTCLTSKNKIQRCTRFLRMK